MRTLSSRDKIVITTVGFAGGGIVGMGLIAATKRITKNKIIDNPPLVTLVVLVTSIIGGAALRWYYINKEKKSSNSEKQ